MMSSLLKTIAKQPRTASIFLRTFSSEVPKFETLAVSVPKPKVYHVELNRPQKLNTFNNDMWIELQKCFGALNDIPDCRVIILSAQGKHFTGGIDLQTMMELKSGADEIEDIARKSKHFYNNIKLYQDGITSIEKCIKPVICLMHSACIGAGVDLCTAADMRFCTQDAWFQIKEVDVGLAPDVGTLQRFPKVVGSTSIARELCYTGRKFDSKEALDIGLVSKVLPDKDSGLKHVLELAETIASKSPVAVQTIKINLVYSQSRPNDDGLMHIRLINQAMLQSEDLPKAAMAQVSKSGTPEFEDY